MLTDAVNPSKSVQRGEIGTLRLAPAMPASMIGVAVVGASSRENAMRLKDKVAVVTGAASGMGAATAGLFAREGAKVMVADVLEAEGEAVANSIKSSGGEARFQRLDVCSEKEWETLTSATLAAYGKIDILINNAGVSGSDPDRLSLATWDRQMSINAKGVFLGMRAVIPVMQRAKGGSIVNISSISGIAGQTFVHMGYNAAKGAVRSMSKAAAVQFAKDGIRVNSVHPGLMPPMRTSMLTADPTVRAGMMKAVPMGREGRVEEVAYANLFLASDEASYITGIELPVDGGFLAM
jgi:NAD(P)-dependent dehydrogenase (short-subunit alcohol dehydrogenase family)